MKITITRSCFYIKCTRRIFVFTEPLWMDSLLSSPYTHAQTIKLGTTHLPTPLTTIFSVYITFSPKQKYIYPIALHLWHQTYMHLQSVKESERKRKTGFIFINLHYHTIDNTDFDIWFFISKKTSDALHNKISSFFLVQHRKKKARMHHLL